MNREAERVVRQQTIDAALDKCDELDAQFLERAKKNHFCKKKTRMAVQQLSEAGLEQLVKQAKSR